MSATEVARSTSVERHTEGVRAWSLAGVMALAVGVAASSLGAVLTEGAWWFPFMAVVLVTLATATAVRRIRQRAILGSVAAFVAAAILLVLMFAADTAVAGVVPTGETFARFAQLVRDGDESIVNQRFPADAETGIVFLICLGALAVTLAMDAAAFVLRKPALTGIPLLILLLVPSFVRSELHDAFVFAVTALAYVAILLVASERAGARVAWPLVSAALVISLIVPVLLPSAELAAEVGNRPGLISTGVNPIINLSSDLRRNAPLLALRYMTEGTGEYLRVAVLDEFGDDTWKPSEGEDLRSGEIETFAAPTGLTAEVPRTENVMQVEIARIRGKYLPVPYASTGISGLQGSWSWEPEGLTVSTTNANSKDQEYEVSYITPAPSIEQLEAAPTSLPEGFEKYLALPETLPDVVAETAQQVAGAAPTRFDQALALQSFFKDGDFAYSENAPLTENYDGSGAAVLGEFLSAKSGYCVHFASAMAAMARTLDIPARVVVGFTPGQKKADAETDEVNFVVSTDNLHAWPELYFPTIGWIRFEPTVSVGSEPRFAQSIADDPSTPDVDESQPEPAATPAPTSTATSGARPDLPLDEQPTTPSTGPLAASPFWWLLLALPVLLFIPALVRVVRRGLRLAAVSRGAVAPAWREVRDTATDLGFDLSATATPRQQYEHLAAGLGASGAKTLAALLASVETAAFSPRDTRVRPGAVAAALTSLRASATWRARVRARWAPRTAFGPVDRRS
ncbi:transglutaminaseTgpA domain-containing protein [Salinibacterium sp. TMP30]|uniref:transglutaminaseTgpA domain-containing protein n=1 Tax=Salinibacterium sp. TMP30 TaxID=3138237 RepID=UPI003138842A